MLCSAAVGRAGVTRTQTLTKSTLDQLPDWPQARKDALLATLARLSTPGTAAASSGKRATAAA